MTQVETKAKRILTDAELDRLDALHQSMVNLVEEARRMCMGTSEEDSAKNWWSVIRPTLDNEWEGDPPFMLNCPYRYVGNTLLDMVLNLTAEADQA